MMARWHENLMPVCKELGITYVAFSPLANGHLQELINLKKNLVVENKILDQICHNIVMRVLKRQMNY